MAASAGEVSLSVRADTKGLGNQLKTDTEREASGADFSGVGRIMGGAIAAGVALVTAGIVAVVKTGFDETMSASAGIAQLNAGIQSTGNVAGVSVKGMTDLASSIQNMSGQTDDSIVKAEGLLQTFTNIRNEGPNKIFDDATLAAANMAAKMGGDASDQAIRLGKALNDPVNGMTALRKVGVQFTDDQAAQITALQASGDMMGAQKIILGELNTEFGGAAAAAGQSLPGQLQILKRNFEDMSQSVMTGVMPALTPLFPVLGDAIKKIAPVLGDMLDKLGPVFGTVLKTLADAIVAIAPTIGDLVGAIGPLLGDAIKMVLPIITDLIKMLGPIFVPIIQALSPILKIIIDAFKQLMPAIMPIIEMVGQLLVPILQLLAPVLNFLLPIIVNLLSFAMIPLKLLLALLVPVIEGISWAFTHMGDVFQWLYDNVIKPVGDAIGVVFNFLYENIIKPVFDNIGLAIQGAGIVLNFLYENVVKPVMDGIATAFNFVWNNVIKPVVDFINGAIQTVGDTINSVFGGIGDFVGGVFQGMADGILGAINWIISNVLNPIIDGINGALDGLSIVSGGTISLHIDKLPNLAFMAEGGIVSQPTLAMIGEGREPEAVVPLSKLGDMAGAGKSGNTIVYNAAPGASFDKEQDLFAAMRRAKLLVGW
jgi:phage-related protein